MCQCTAAQAHFQPGSSKQTSALLLDLVPLHAFSTAFGWCRHVQQKDSLFDGRPSCRTKGTKEDIFLGGKGLNLISSMTNCCYRCLVANSRKAFTRLPPRLRSLRRHLHPRRGLEECSSNEIAQLRSSGVRTDLPTGSRLLARQPTVYRALSQAERMRRKQSGAADKLACWTSTELGL